jgi:hypothetical protein
MADDEDIAALVIDNGSGMCKGTIQMCLHDWIYSKSPELLLGMASIALVVYFAGGLISNHFPTVLFIQRMSERLHMV